MPRKPSTLSLFERADTTVPAVTCLDFRRLPGGSLSSTIDRLPVLDDSSEEEDLDDLSARDGPRTSPQDAESVLGGMVVDSTSTDAEPSGPTKPEKRTAYTPLPHWRQHREVFLEELLRLEGRGDFAGRGCSHCQEPQAIYRCTQCTCGVLLCQSCIIESHKYNPLHVIEKWTDDSYFEKTTLKSLGLKIQLGHLPGEKCLNPRRPHKDGFVVLDLNGIQVILRYGWYLASTERPQTAATTNLLKFFQILSFESKSSLFEFYNALARLSDNTGTLPGVDRYQALLIMIREWRHLKSLKRGARGHKPGGAAGTQPGELATLCPACPQPGINMSPGWENAPLELRFLYCLFLAIDANFRLKRRNISNEAKDPSLSDGLLYFAPQTQYQSHITQFGEVIEQKKSTCSNHQAVNAERASKGYATTGVVAVDCARHDMKRPLAVGDLQKGERYVNTDFVFFSSLQSCQYSNVVVSYDICCQWSKKLWTRMEQYSSTSLAIPEEKKSSFRFLVPKFHLPSHVVECQTKYSFNFAPHVGRTDGEAPERGWAKINPIAPSTSEMGPGNRCDTLNDLFMDNNWWKSANMGVALARKKKEALEAAADYRFLHNQFSLGLPASRVEEWDEALKRWERSPQTHQNPFEKRFEIITLERVKKRLNEEEEWRRKNQVGYSLDEEISAIKLVTMGLDLEEQQRKLSRKTAKPESADSGGQDGSGYEASIVLQRTDALNRKLQSFFAIQHLYVPALHAIRKRDAESSPSEVPPTSVKLYLPSDPICIKHATTSDQRLINIEHQLRCAQAEDALNELRNALRLRSYLYIDKDRFQRGQKRNTRSRSIIARLEEKVSSAAVKYRIAREAISHLASALGLAWSTSFPALNKGDICSFNDDDLPTHMKPALNLVQKKELLKLTSKKVRKMCLNPPSWIWKRLGAYNLNDEALEEDVRIEYCKSSARAARWKEEVMLLDEEMQRVKNFFRYRSSMWLDLACTVDKSMVLASGDKGLEEGRKAYAIQQSNMFSLMVKRCETLWNPHPSDDETTHHDEGLGTEHPDMTGIEMS